MKNTILLLIIISSLSSCMVIGSIAGGKKTTFEKDFVLKQKSTIDKTKADLKQALYSRGWNKTEEEANKIQFVKSSSLIKELATSRVDLITINIAFSDNDVVLQIIRHGNFKAGTEQNVDKTFYRIKESYERL